MDRRFSRVIEHNEGNGQLFDNSTYIDDVYYNFQITQKFTSSESDGVTQITPGLKSALGVIKLKNKKISITRKYIRLKISDNRTFKILITKFDPVKGEFGMVVQPDN